MPLTDGGTFLPAFLALAGLTFTGAADHSLGTFACLKVNAVGSDDVNVYRLLDEDTKCILEVRGGPSMVDNAVIAECAKAARDNIGLANIK